MRSPFERKSEFAFPLEVSWDVDTSASTENADLRIGWKHRNDWVSTRARKIAQTFHLSPRLHDDRTRNPTSTKHNPHSVTKRNGAGRRVGSATHQGEHSRIPSLPGTLRADKRTRTVNEFRALVQNGGRNPWRPSFKVSKPMTRNAGVNTKRVFLSNQGPVARAEDLIAISKSPTRNSVLMQVASKTKAGGTTERLRRGRTRGDRW